ncbi:MAG TPA: saccharopine dehydrogenase NADP-binding domain-containing protein [Caulobacteraceae bacterium]|jgi:hypothetical protein
MIADRAQTMGAARTVAVLGAAGHTGRFVVSELLRRGLTPIAVGRDGGRLKALEFAGQGVECREASADNAGALDRALAGAAAVVNCAGPFLDTADAVASAALRAGAHYFDVTAEQASAQLTFDHFDAAAREAAVVVIPAMGFFGGFADLLVAAAMDDWDAADDIRIRIAFDSWLPTQGTRMTGARNTAPRCVIAGGRLERAPQPPARTVWDFPAPFGRQSLVELPFSEVPLIARRLRTTELHTYLNEIALRDVGDPLTPTPKPADATGRSAQRFAVEVIVRRSGVGRRILAQGRDIYAFSAPLVCEAVERVLSGEIQDIGAQSPGAVFDAPDFLRALAPEHLTFEIAAA